MKKLSVAFAILLISTFGCGSAMSGDSKEDRIQNLYDRFEGECIEKGWQKLTIDVGGVNRKILWKGPKAAWKYGTIIALHGGGGTYSNFCANIRIGKPMVEFGDLAISEGFAVFSLESEEGYLRDKKGASCGKRWLSMAQENKVNPDLQFIEKVITETIPRLRPSGSSSDIFMTGISNGGFMTILASTHFSDKITAFAPVSAGDPYGIYVDCTEGSAFRATPGKLIDSETKKPVNKDDACKAKEYTHEKNWKSARSKDGTPFKFFYHEGDAVLDISCKKKAQHMLVKHGYKNEGAFVVDGGIKRILNHFWISEYNRPLIEFFKSFSNDDQKQQHEQNPK
jgi:poly(3-hydroxybutyrate) depolymerase